MEGLQEGYDFFAEYSGADFAAQMGGEWVESINCEVENLLRDFSSFEGSNKEIDFLSGDLAEFWHADTFNINAAIKESSNRASVPRSTDFASADITDKLGHWWQVKYYRDGIHSAKAQAMTFEEAAHHGSATAKQALEQGIANRNDLIYPEGMGKVIPQGQETDAQQYLERMAAKESARRPEQVKRYVDAKKDIFSTIDDRMGIKSKELDRGTSKTIAMEVKDGSFRPEKYHLTTEQLLQVKDVLKKATKAGASAAAVAAVLSAAPAILEAIDYLTKTGNLDISDLFDISIAAAQGGGFGFITGTISAAVVESCKAGMLGGALVNANAAAVAAIVVVAVRTTSNAFKVAKGEMSRGELTECLISDIFITGSSILVGLAVQAVLPTFGYLLGSFIGSVIGGFAFSASEKVFLSFCVDKGFTFFGLVEQSYILPDSVIEQVGVEMFDYEKADYDNFEPDRFDLDMFDTEEFEFDRFEITPLRRGVLGVSKVGYLPS